VATRTATSCSADSATDGKTSTTTTAATTTISGAAITTQVIILTFICIVSAVIATSFGNQFTAIIRIILDIAAIGALVISHPF
jgi:hypothetical protein